MCVIPITAYRTTSTAVITARRERARYFDQAFQMLWEQYPYVQVAIVWNLNFRDIVPSDR